MPFQNRQKITLYTNRFSPYAQRVHLVLDAKNIPYETVYINVSSKPEWFMEKSPLGKIPALELNNGDVLYESLIISDYLDEKYEQNRLHASDPLQKAKDKLLIEQFSKVINTMYKLLLSSNRGCMDDYYTIINDGLQTFEKEISKRKGPYFGGNKPGMLDYMIWPWCERADLLKLFGNQNLLRKDKFKRLMEWRRIMMTNSTVKKSLIDSETHLKFLQSHRAGMPDYELLSN